MDAALRTILSSRPKGGAGPAIPSGTRSTAQKIVAQRAARGGVPMAMASPPTLAIRAHNANYTIASGVYVPVTDAAFSYLGGKPAVLAATARYGWNLGVGGNVEGRYASNGLTIAPAHRGVGILRPTFNYNGRYLDICTTGHSATDDKTFRVWVNDQPVALAVNDGLLTTSQNQRVSLDFGTAAMRKIAFEMGPWCSFGGVVREPAHAVSAAANDSPRIIQAGDSYTEGTTPAKILGLCQVAGRHLGCWDYWNAGEGGVGYVEAGITSGLNFAQKVASDVVANAPDWSVVALGINDDDKDPATVNASVVACVRAILDGAPHAGVTVIGPWRGPNLNPPDAIFDAIRTAVQTQPEHGGRLTYVDTKALAWQDPADGSDYYDAIHPTQPERDRLGALTGAAVLAHATAVSA